jgi:hypothetical protein
LLVPSLSLVPIVGPCGGVLFAETTAEVIATCGTDCCVKIDNSEAACDWPALTIVGVCKGSCMDHLTSIFDVEDAILNADGSGSCIRNTVCLENTEGKIDHSSSLFYHFSPSIEDKILPQLRKRIHVDLYGKYKESLNMAKINVEKVDHGIASEFNKCNAIVTTVRKSLNLYVENTLLSGLIITHIIFIKIITIQ